MSTLLDTNIELPIIIYDVPFPLLTIMPRAGLIKPTHKAVQLYYQTLQSFDHQHVKHEGALRSAFQTMLADTARTHNWTLVPELATKAGGKRVIPDGTMRDPNSLPRGY